MHPQQMKELESLKTSAQDKLKEKSINNLRKEKLTEITTSKEDVKSFIVNFINTSITDKDLKDKMLENLEKIDLRIADNDTIGKNEIIKVNENNQEVRKHHIEAWLGKPSKNGMVKTDLKKIRGIIHELTHSTSQKFSEEFINGNKQEADPGIGEIETKFIEKVFNNYLKENAETLGNSNSLGLTTENIKHDAEYFESYDLDNFIHQIGKIQDLDKERIKLEIKKSNLLKKLDTKNKRKKIKISQKIDSCNEKLDSYNGQMDYENRYIIGHVVSSEYFNGSYLKNKEGTIAEFSEFLKKNAEMNLNESVQLATKGNCMDYGKIVEKFTEKKEPHIGKVDRNNPEFRDYIKQNKIKEARFQIERAKKQKNAKMSAENIIDKQM